MKKYLSPTVIAMFFLACGQSQKDDKGSPNTFKHKEATCDSSNKDNHSLLLQYKQYLEGLDKEQMNNVLAAMLNYEWMFKGKEKAVCDSGFYFFNEFYESVYGHVQEHRPQEVSVKRKTEFEQQIKRYGFKIAFYEGAPYYVKDRDSVNPKFYNYVSPLMKQFMLQQHTETNNDCCIAEGGIVISPAELADRYAFWQQFGEDNKQFMMKTTVLMYANDYAEKLVHGTDNTPLLSNEKLNPFYKNAFTQLFSHYAGKKYAEVFKQYYDALLKKDMDGVNSFKEWFSTTENKSVLRYEDD